MKKILFTLAVLVSYACLASPAPAEQLIQARFCQAQKPAMESDAFRVDRPSDTRICFYMQPTDILSASCTLVWKVVDEKTDAPVLSGTTQLSTSSSLAACTPHPLPAGLYELHARCVQKHTSNFCVQGVIAR